MLLYFKNLQVMGVVRTWTTLNSWIDDPEIGFPAGHLVGRHRVWLETEIAGNTPSLNVGERWHLSQMRSGMRVVVSLRRQCLPALTPIPAPQRAGRSPAVMSVRSGFLYAQKKAPRAGGLRGFLGVRVN